MTQYHQTTVEITGGPKVNLQLDPDRVSHLKARDGLEALQDAGDVSQQKALEWALVCVTGAPTPKEALELITAAEDWSNAEACRYALRETMALQQVQTDE